MNIGLDPLDVLQHAIRESIAVFELWPLGSALSAFRLSPKQPDKHALLSQPALFAWFVSSCIGANWDLVGKRVDGVLTCTKQNGNHRHR